MDAFDREILALSLERLKDVLPMTPAALMKEYEEDSRRYCVETIGDHVFCLFTWPVLSDLERIILLVFDSSRQIIADIGAYHTDAKSFLESREIYDYLSEESDWMYLEHYVLSSTVFHMYPYPFCLSSQKAEEAGEVLIYVNAYVSRAMRRQHIFRAMLESVSCHVFQEATGILPVYSVFSLDPDIACFGPDAEDEPYYYSYEADEPVRRRNARIAERIGFTPLKLEMEHPEEETDGTKLWFCVGQELFEAAETPFGKC